MNADAKRIVDVQITKESRGVSSANFSTPIFLTKTVKAGAVGRVETYMSPTEVQSAGYLATSPEYLASQAHFSVTGAPKYFKLGFINTAETPTQAITAISAIDNDWYGVLVSDAVGTTSSADYKALGDWCPLNGKFLFAGESRAIVFGVDTTSVPYTLNLTATPKSCVIYNGALRVATDMTAYADVAYASMILGKLVGDYTADGKTLTGMKADNLTTTQRNTLKANTKNATWYNPIYGRDVTENSKTCAGTLADWVDIEIGIDWLSTRLQEEVITTIFNSEKIPYTDEGAQILASAVETVLRTAKRQGFLASYTISVAPVSQSTTTDKTNRVYNGISFSAVLAGAIHSTVIKGSVRV